MQEHPEVVAQWGPNPNCERGYAFPVSSTFVFFVHSLMRLKMAQNLHMVVVKI